jgi:NAD(P)H dehydrogenase (quinone)
VKCLVVIAHPLRESLCMELARAVRAEITASGHELRVQDLYGDGFSPVLTAEERLKYYTSFPRDGLEWEIASLEWAEMLILVFPTWWFGFPAILKGWFDRAWAPGIAYDHAADMGSIKPRLHGLRKAVAITTLGSPWWIDWLVFRRPVRRVLKTGILGPCAPNCRLKFVSVYGSEKLSVAAVESAKQQSVSAVRSMLSR